MEAAENKSGVVDAWRALGMRCAALCGLSTALFSLLNDVNVGYSCLRGLAALLAVRLIVGASAALAQRLERPAPEDPEASVAEEAGAGLEGLDANV